MIILTWNIRGLGDSFKRRGIRYFCQLNKIDIICIKEIKLECYNDSILKSLSGSFINNWTVKDTNGSSGGLIIGLKSQCWRKISDISTNFCLTVIIESANKESVLAISSIYGSHEFNDKQIL